MIQKVLRSVAVLGFALTSLVEACQWCTQDNIPAFNFFRDLGVEQGQTLTPDELKKLLEHYAAGSKEGMQDIDTLLDMIAHAPVSDASAEEVRDTVDGALSANESPQQAHEAEPVMPSAHDADECVMPAKAAELASSVSFYEQYVKPYFPRARRITIEYFSAMCPRAIDRALDSLVDLLGNQDKQWFYFCNEATQFRPADYWELVLGQCELIDEFLTASQVGASNCVTMIQKKASSFGFLMSKPKAEEGNVLLLECFDQIGLTAYQRFYALYFDYANKLFNEAIMFFESSGVTKYKRIMSNIAPRLEGTVYEVRCSEVLRVSGQLSEIMTRRRKELGA